VTETYLHDELAERLLRQVEQLPEAAALLAAARGTGRLAVRGLTGSSRALLAAWLQRQLGRTVLVLTAHGEPFDEMRDDLEYFAGAGAVLAYPEPDVLPYDPSSPHPGITAQRLDTLARLARGDRGVIVATARGVVQKVPRPQRLEGVVVHLRTGADVDPRALVERLVLLGYERLPEVESVGQFARRGGILDVYPVGLADPLRIEYRGTPFDEPQLPERARRVGVDAMEDRTAGGVPPRPHPSMFREKRRNDEERSAYRIRLLKPSLEFEVMHEANGFDRH